MKVTKVTAEILAEKITDYLLRRTSIKELVDWSENMIMEAEYSDEDFESIREILAHLGVANVRQFGLSWDDCYGPAPLDNCYSTHCFQLCCSC